MNFTISVNTLTESYCERISAAFAAQGWNKLEAGYLNLLKEIQLGHRAMLVAEVEGEFAGYVTVVWNADYPPFREAAIPEISDFKVLKRFQRQGIGSALLDEAERLIGQRSKVAGIGVGLYADYGTAHRLYIKRGYLPDGRGLFQDGRILTYGDQATVNDDLALYFTRNLD
ncbi:MAG: GNAT family N-acetyltransferase [Chloroflexi bacterium]|nr:GNAT family N-acetyltransferase [Chloroflexota bacterium]OJV92628.1 MAG: GNAT family N-acetyltransferase [Chloroflexi bacterium 54-19]